MAKLSNRRRQAIYSAVLDCVTEARLRLGGYSGANPWSETDVALDTLLATLGLNASSAAVGAAMGDYDSARERVEKMKRGEYR